MDEKVKKLIKALDYAYYHADQCKNQIIDARAYEADALSSFDLALRLIDQHLEMLKGNIDTALLAVHMKIKDLKKKDV